ncbi:hypothetical protein KIPB_012487, partial [Kipferlia bialata]
AWFETTGPTPSPPKALTDVTLGPLLGECVVECVETVSVMCVEVAKEAERAKGGEKAGSQNGTPRHHSHRHRRHRPRTHTVNASLIGPRVCVERGQAILTALGMVNPCPALIRPALLLLALPPLSSPPLDPSLREACLALMAVIKLAAEQLRGPSLTHADVFKWFKPMELRQGMAPILARTGGVEGVEGEEVAVAAYLCLEEVLSAPGCSTVLSGMVVGTLAALYSVSDAPIHCLRCMVNLSLEPRPAEALSAAWPLVDILSAGCAVPPDVTDMAGLDLVVTRLTVFSNLASSLPALPDIPQDALETLARASYERESVAGQLLSPTASLALALLYAREVPVTQAMLAAGHPSTLLALRHLAVDIGQFAKIQRLTGSVRHKSMVMLKGLFRTLTQAVREEARRQQQANQRRTQVEE